MRRRLSCLLFVGVLGGVCIDVLAIATSSDVISAQNPTNHGYSLNWDYVYKYKNSSSVAVDHYWILTAFHVADDGGSGSLTINGEVYNQQEIVFHPTADLALVRYDKPFPGYYPLHDGEIHNGKKPAARVYYPLIMAGYGYPGSVTAATFSQSGNSGTKRWGTNRGVSETLANADIDGVVKFTQCFRTDFTISDTPFEAGANTRDSGGPVFIEDGSEWKLTGIILYRNGTDPIWTGNYSAMIYDYITWIKSVIVDYDSDMDGLPDWWETLYGGDATSMEPDDHLDSDGFANYEEWLADTIPTDGNSFLKITEYTNANSLVFSSSSNRKYQVQYRTDFMDTNELWQTEADWFDGLSPQTEQSVATSTSNRFYRVRATLR